MKMNTWMDSCRKWRQSKENISRSIRGNRLENRDRQQLAFILSHCFSRYMYHSQTLACYVTVSQLCWHCEIISWRLNERFVHLLTEAKLVDVLKHGKSTNERTRQRPSRSKGVDEWSMTPLTPGFFFQYLNNIPHLCPITIYVKTSVGTNIRPGNG